MDDNQKDVMSKPATLIIVIGLPGSGKSMCIEDILKGDPEATQYDDYQGGAYADNSDPRLSRNYGPLLIDLKHGKTSVVSDVRYCVPGELGKFLGAVLSVVPNVVLDFRYFVNDPEQCKKNVVQRDREDRVEEELKLIDELTKLYKVSTTETIRVYSNRS